MFGSGSETQKDIEMGKAPRGKYRFRGAGHLNPNGQARCMQLRNKLLVNLDESHYKLELLRKSSEELKKINRKASDFYRLQNERLDDWLEVDRIVRALGHDISETLGPRDDKKDRISKCVDPLHAQGRFDGTLLEDGRIIEFQRQKLAFNINMAANVSLFVVEGLAICSSTSLLLFAYFVYSIICFLTSAMVLVPEKIVSMHMKDPKQFPRRSMESLGMAAISIIMTVSFTQIVNESAREIFSRHPRIPVQISPNVINSMVATICLRGLICFRCDRVNASRVQALEQDSQTDIISNATLLLFFAVGRTASTWWFDSLSAGLLSIFIIYRQGRTLLQTTTQLSGSIVNDRTMEKITFLAWRFSGFLKAFKSIEARYVGDGVWAQVDIIFDENTTKEDANDVAEMLQYCMERLPEVDRAFISCSFATRQIVSPVSIPLIH